MGGGGGVSKRVGILRPVNQHGYIKASGVGRKRDRERQRHKNRDRETDRDIQRQTETDRDIQRQTDRQRTKRRLLIETTFESSPTQWRKKKGEKRKQQQLKLKVLNKLLFFLPFFFSVFLFCATTNHRQSVTKYRSLQIPEHVSIFSQFSP